MWEITPSESRITVERYFVNMTNDVVLSNGEVRRGITIPQKLTEDLAEEIGMHIGDGSMNTYKGRFLYSLRGHLIDDEKYYENHVKTLFKKLYGIEVHIRRWPDVIGFQISSNAIGSFKHKIIGLPSGPKLNIKIPDSIIKRRKLFLACLRGIFDTDGCLSFEKKSREIPYYPRIILTTTSENLNNQMVYLLREKMKFNLSTWCKKNLGTNRMPAYITCVRGKENLIKWFKLIGSSNPKNKFKYTYWKKHGYYRRP